MWENEGSLEDLKALIDRIPGSFAAFTAVGGHLRVLCASAGLPFPIELHEEDAAPLRGALSMLSGGQDESECVLRLAKPVKGLERCRARLRKFGVWGGNDVILANLTGIPAEAANRSTAAEHGKQSEEIIQRITNLEFEFIALIDVNAQTISLQYTDSWIAPEEMGLPRGYEKYFLTKIVRIVPEEREVCLKNAQIDNLVRQLSRSAPYSFSYTQQAASGNLRKQLKYCWLDEARRLILVTKSDITRIYQQEQAQMRELSDALLAAKRANETKSEFLANISHDMRTPLNGILGYTELALKADDSAAVRDYLQKARQSGEMLLQLINDTLDLNRLENGVVQLRPAPIASSKLLALVVTAVQPSMDRKGIRFLTKITPEGSIQILADSLRVQEIFINLLSNAVKFTPEGGRIDFEISWAEQPEPLVQGIFTVRDSGVGMSEEFLPKMFEPFSQERPMQTSSAGGSGLGLAIVRRLVERMGGKISVHSEIGRGTEITVALQFYRAEPVRSLNVPPTVAFDLAGKHVLLCEDNPINTEITKTMLEAQRLSVSCTASGTEAVSVFSASAPGDFDAILMDIRMPGIDGYETARRIRALARPDAKTVPILAMTADAYVDDVRKSEEAGMNVHITKPIDAGVLCRELARLCAG